MTIVADTAPLRPRDHLREASIPGVEVWGAGLTRRELGVAIAAARGLPTREIAAQLYVSPRTVEHHLMHIYRKFGISSRSQLCAVVIDHLLAERHAS